MTHVPINMDQDVLDGLIREAEKAMNYLNCCRYIEMKPGTKYEWPNELEYFILRAKGEPIPEQVIRARQLRMDIIADEAKS